jgi:ABC-type amino acid transport substrate-binding protein
MLGVMADDRFGHRVLYSRPYYHAKYQVAVRSGDELPPVQEPFAVEQGVAVRGLGGRAARFYPSTAAILDGIAQGHERAGYVISTRGPWLAHERWTAKLSFLPAPESVDRFPICAAVRKSDGDLRDAIDRAWAELDRSGQLAKVFARWHVPYEPGAVAQTRNEPGP